MHGFDKGLLRVRATVIVVDHAKKEDEVTFFSFLPRKKTKTGILDCSRNSYVILKSHYAPTSLYNDSRSSFQPSRNQCTHVIIQLVKRHPGLLRGNPSTAINIQFSPT
ncbi:unnamed protein product [Ixodes persulcatus]